MRILDLMQQVEAGKVIHFKRQQVNTHLNTKAFGCAGMKDNELEMSFFKYVEQGITQHCPNFGWGSFVV